MKIRMLFLLLITAFGCNSQSKILSESEFTKKCLDAVQSKYPNQAFYSDTPLVIVVKDREIVQNLGTFYRLYQETPDSLESIIDQYLRGNKDVLTYKPEIQKENIIPVIKPNAYLESILDGNKNSGSSLEPVYERYDEDLLIFYGENLPNTVRFFNTEDFKSLEISRDTLRNFAVANFLRILPEAELLAGPDGAGMIDAGGEFESSLMLVSKFWRKENFPVNGDIVIAVSNRNRVYVTGSNDKLGIARIKEDAQKSFESEPQPISNALYRWTGEKFVKF